MLCFIRIYFLLFMPLCKLYSVLLIPFFLCAGLYQVSAQQTIKARLLEQVKQIPLPDSMNLVSAFLLINEKPEFIAATPLLVEDLSVTIIAAAALDKGKIILFGSPAYFDTKLIQDPAVSRLLENSLKIGVKKGAKINVGLLNSSNKALVNFLNRQNTKVYELEDFKSQQGLDVLFLTDDVKDSITLKAIESFIRKGGTLMYGSPFNKHYKSRYTSNNDAVADLAINKLFLKSGLVNVNYLITPIIGNKVYTDSIAPYLLPEKIIAMATDPLAQIFSKKAYEFLVEPMLQLMFQFNDGNSAILNKFKALIMPDDSLPLPSKNHPLLLGTAKLKLIYKLKSKLYEKEVFDRDASAKAPGAKLFPGGVPDNAERVNEQITIPVKVGIQGLHEIASVYYRPHTTGLYVPAGGKVKIIINAALKKQYLKAQIGVHSDDLTNMDVLTRDGADLTRTFELDKDSTDIYSPYGGLLLIKIADTSKLKTISVTVNGAVKAPYFKLGTTTIEEWQKNIRNYPAPWAELATDKIILTVPSYRIRNLADPEKLLKFWDEVMDADADLAAVSRKRAYEERIIVDEQVGYGYMFTLPDRIVVPDDKSAELMLDADLLHAKGSWGHFHEMGHRHQFWGIDFDGTSEVTVNLFSMYVYDKVLHKGIYNHDAILNKEVVDKRIIDYLSKAPDYQKWSDDPFTALSMYIELIDEFGWEPFKTVHAKYRLLTADKYPKSNQDRIDLWFVSCSNATHTNLNAFFEVWKIPVSDEAKKKVQNYKSWLPIKLRLYGFMK